MAYKILNLDTWNRKDHFSFFSSFEEPFFGVTVEVEASQAYQRARQRGCSFFLYYLHGVLTAVNETESFRYRVVGDEVRIYDAIQASATINRSDGTFGFSRIAYAPDLDAFVAGAMVEIERVSNTTGLDPGLSDHDVIHFSALPWLRFTSLSHARSFSTRDCIPKISVGKLSKGQHDNMLLPVSVHVHHGLMDGIHVGTFFERLQEILDRTQD